MEISLGKPLIRTAAGRRKVRRTMLDEPTTDDATVAARLDRLESLIELVARGADLLAVHASR